MLDLSQLRTDPIETVRLPNGRVVDVHQADAFAMGLVVRAQRYLHNQSTEQPTFVELDRAMATLIPDASDEERGQLQPLQQIGILLVAAGQANLVLELIAKLATAEGTEGADEADGGTEGNAQGRRGAVEPQRPSSSTTTPSV